MARLTWFALLLSLLPATALAQPCTEPLAVLFERVSPAVPTSDVMDASTYCFATSSAR